MYTVTTLWKDNAVTTIEYSSRYTAINFARCSWRTGVLKKCILVTDENGTILECLGKIGE